MEDGEKSEPLDPEDAALFAALEQEMADRKGRVRFLDRVRLLRLAGDDGEGLKLAEQFAGALMRALGFEEAEIEGHGVVWRRAQTSTDA